MSETNCPHCGKEAGSICIQPDCPIRPPRPSKEQLDEMVAALSGQITNADRAALAALPTPPKGIAQTDTPPKDEAR